MQKKRAIQMAEEILLLFDYSLDTDGENILLRDNQLGDVEKYHTLWEVLDDKHFDVDIKNFIYETLDYGEELNAWDVSAYNFLHSITAQRMCEKISAKDVEKYFKEGKQCLKD